MIGTRTDAWRAPLGRNTSIPLCDPCDPLRPGGTSRPGPVSGSSDTRRSQFDRGTPMSVPPPGAMPDAFDRLRSAVRTLPGVLAGFSEAEAGERPSPERWAKKEVVGHLIDSASNNHRRFVLALLAAG